MRGLTPPRPRRQKKGHSAIPCPFPRGRGLSLVFIIVHIVIIIVILVIIIRIIIIIIRVYVIKNDSDLPETMFALPRTWPVSRPQMVQVVSMEEVPRMLGSTSFQSKEVKGAQKSEFLLLFRRHSSLAGGGWRWEGKENFDRGENHV